PAPAQDQPHRRQHHDHRHDRHDEERGRVELPAPLRPPLLPLPTSKLLLRSHLASVPLQRRPGSASARPTHRSTTVAASLPSVSPPGPSAVATIRSDEACSSTDTSTGTRVLAVRRPGSRITSRSKNGVDPRSVATENRTAPPPASRDTSATTPRPGSRTPASTDRPSPRRGPTTPPTRASSRGPPENRTPPPPASRDTSATTTSPGSRTTASTDRTSPGRGLSTRTTRVSSFGPAGPVGPGRSTSPEHAPSTAASSTAHARFM